MRLMLNVDHIGGTVAWDSRDPFRFNAATDAFRAFAYAKDADTEIRLPGSAGEVVTVKAGDVDSFDLRWEA